MVYAFGAFPRNMMPVDHFRYNVTPIRKCIFSMSDTRGRTGTWYYPADIMQDGD